jgi:hypothetical protein
MNKDRRTSLEAIANKIDGLKCELETLRDEEQEYFDNMPESLQGSDKGETAENAISNLDDAINSLEESMNSINESAT